MEIYMLEYKHNVTEDLRNFNDDNAYYDLKMEIHKKNIFGKIKVRRYTKRVAFHAFSIRAYENMFDGYIANKVNLANKKDYYP